MDLDIIQKCWRKSWRTIWILTSRCLMYLIPSEWYITAKYNRTTLLASERSKWDTYKDNTIENWGYLFVYILCLDVYRSFCTLTPRIFVLALFSTPSQTSLNRILWLSIITHIILEIKLLTALNYFAGAVKTKKHTGVPFLFKLVVMVS